MQKVRGSAGGRKRRDVALKMRGPLRQSRERRTVVQRQRRSATARLVKLALVGVKMDEEEAGTDAGGDRRQKLEQDGDTEETRRGDAELAETRRGKRGKQ